MRTPLIAANWKMYKTPQQTEEFFSAFLPIVGGHQRDSIAIFPSATSLPAAVKAVHGSDVAIGCQNMHWLDEGAYTGETSAPMVVGVGCTHILIGHSERRQYCSETDEVVNRKLHTAIKHSLVPVVCVGESDAEREAGQTEQIIRRQVEGALANLSAVQLAPLVIAYEPVWAIGTGKTATPQTAAEAHLSIRSVVARLFGRTFADALRILYGGSVKPENAAVLMNEPEIDGALVGGASLDPQSFAKIVMYATQ
jgi:triosephosphate isomerase (TIM)